MEIVLMNTAFKSSDGYRKMVQSCHRKKNFLKMRCKDTFFCVKMGGFLGKIKVVLSLSIGGKSAIIKPLFSQVVGKIRIKSKIID